MDKNRDLKRERNEIQAEIERVTKKEFVGFRMSEVIKLDIGGQTFTTTRRTLARCPETVLAAIANGHYDADIDPDGRYFIDRDGTHFR